MSIFAWIVIGLMMGFIAHKLMDKVGGTLLFDLGLGLFGGVAGGFVVSLIGHHDYGTFNLWSALASMVGATAMLVVHHGISARRSTV